MLDLRMGGNINKGSWAEVSALDDDDDDDDGDNQEPISRTERDMYLWHGVFTNQLFFQSHKPASKTYRPKNDRRRGASIFAG